jgi:hypothetical protein
MKIQYDPKKPIPVEIKRFYLPLTISDECPECGAEVENDCEITYLSYPTLNVPHSETFWCEDCDEEWVGWIQLDLTVKAVAAPDDDTDEDDTDDNEEPTDASSS